MAKKLIGVLIVACLVGVLAVVSHIHVISWNFPDQFNGWARVQFEDRNCGTETNSHWPFKLVTVRVGKSGIGCSPDSFPSGWTYDKYVYLKPDGRRVPVSSEYPGRAGLPLGYSFEQKTYILF